MGYYDMILNDMNPNAQAGLSYGQNPNVTPEAMGRATNATMGALGSRLGKSALGAAVNYGMGMPAGMIPDSVMSGLMSPASIAGVAAAPVNATLGLGPTSALGKLGLSGVVGLMGMLGGPVAGIAGSLLGGLGFDALGDAFDMRSEEQTRDDMESKLGWGEGHSTYADTKDVRDRTKSVSMNENAARAKSMDLQSMLDLAAEKMGVSKYSAPVGYGWGTTDYGGGYGMNSYGGFDSLGGPMGGARAIDAGYGPNMGGWGGLGIGNPSSYGGGNGGIGSVGGGGRGIGGVSGADLGKGSEGW
jgi:hypothetical protein